MPPSALAAMKMKGGEQTGGMGSIFVEGEGVICIYVPLLQLPRPRRTERGSPHRPSMLVKGDWTSSDTLK